MSVREYKTISALRHGEIIDLEGIRLRMDVDDNGKEKDIAVGDLYIAERNTGPHLLTAASISPRGWIKPTTNHYNFDISECVKVVEAK